MVTYDAKEARTRAITLRNLRKFAENHGMAINDGERQSTDAYATEFLLSIIGADCTKKAEYMQYYVAFKEAFSR
jgi:hypothetical protein